MVHAIHGSHRLTGLTRKSLLKLRQVPHHAIGAKLLGRVRIGLHPQPQVFGAIILAPILSKGNEELLVGS